MREGLGTSNRDLEQKIEKLQQEIDGFMQDKRKLTQEKNILQETKNKLSWENISLQSELDEHSDCIIRSWSNTCYCQNGDVLPIKYCPAITMEHPLPMKHPLRPKHPLFKDVRTSL